MATKLSVGDVYGSMYIESINGNEFFDANIGGVMAIQLFKENNPINHNRRYILSVFR